MRTRLLVFLATHFGTVFVLALMQRAEGRSPYEDDADATDQMAADERIHGEVLRGLAARGREQLSGTFRAAVFGANDGLVSNLALVLGIGATGVDARTVLFTGIAGLLAGALSMGAGEYVSVRSQRELLQSTQPDPESQSALPHLDVDANELALVYRARGMDPTEAERARADGAGHPAPGRRPAGRGRRRPARGGRLAWSAALSSFCFFASGALIPVLPYLFGASGGTAVVIAAALVGIWPCWAPARWSASCPAPRRCAGRCVSSASATAPRPPPTCSGWRSARRSRNEEAPANGRRFLETYEW